LTEAPRPTIRLDKWLWHARFFKSRSIASGVVTGGKVRVGGNPVSKPARAVGPGDVLTFVQADVARVIRILDCGTRRGPAPEAQALYEDLTPATVSDPRPPAATARDAPPKRTGGI
jgi:Ribosome-associated heat shock protein implicated in the recycling of the 50S subunit (S4 paralog)